MARKRSKQGSAKPVRSRQLKRSQIEAEEVAELDRIIQAGAPTRSTDRAQLGHAPSDEETYAEARKFSALPISKNTLKGLGDHGFKSLTAIQRACIPHALCGRDVLGAAKTGSGKTLAFIVPVMEGLYRARWTEYDGLGALMISPTRELALQIFEELRKVGKYHSFSAGLLIGGKSVDEEAKHINSMNILVAAPGRLLHHMDSTPGFDCGNIICLVLDEADRCLDLGFSGTMDAIVANLPRARHTMLFSATQSKKVSDLARLSLKDPEYISVHAEAPTATPNRLKQFYVTAPLHSKLDILWFFVKTHLKKRTIVFLATCKQVKFVYEAFRKLRPGVPLAMLHGKMKQSKRMGVFYSFNESKATVLFATDIAARGLDFPNVDWVFQADCPEDSDAYIHRVGRTARFQASGEALLFLLPSEEQGMLEALKERRVPLKQRAFAAGKVTPIGDALTALLARSEDLKAAAQAAFVSYIRSVFLNPNKTIFDVAKLDVDEFASSLGLPTAPRLRMVKKLQRQSAAAGVRGAHRDQDDTEKADRGVDGSVGSDGDVAAADESPTDDGASSDREQTAVQAPMHDEPQSGGTGQGAALESDEDDLLVVKRRDVLNSVPVAGKDPVEEPEEVDVEPPKPKKTKKMKIKPGKGTGTKTVFDADGRQLDPLEALQSALKVSEHRSATERFEDERERMRQRDADDRLVEKRRRQEAKARKKARAREAEEDQGAGGAVVTLRSPAASDDCSSSDVENSEDVGPVEPMNKRRRKSGAYVGMVDAGGSGSDSGSEGSPEPQQQSTVKRMSVAEQEALALTLL